MRIETLFNLASVISIVLIVILVILGAKLSEMTKKIDEDNPENTHDK